MSQRHQLRILFAASEGVPFSKTGGLADVIGSLPLALSDRGLEVAVVLPRYRETKLDGASTLVRSLKIPVGDHLHFPSIIEVHGKGPVRWLLVDYPPFFDRESLYVAPDGHDYPDNPERFALFSRCVLEIAKSLFPPDLIHCHDWQTSLVPVLLKTACAGDTAINGIPVILTIHNLGFQGLFPPDALRRVGLGTELFTMEGIEFYGKVNFLKGGLLFADAITTVSRKYSQEIQTPEYGFGLESVLQQRADRLHGILNEVDYAQWDPEVDPYIAAPYNSSNLAGKKACKKELEQEFGLPEQEGPAYPLLGIVSRFTRQKGIDLIAEAADRLMTEKVRLVALGTGEKKYENFFLDLAARYRSKVAVRIAYDNSLAHKIEAGSDMFLMPSFYEPCGLNQIYSLRYGTVPVVRATGGLEDTIEDYNPATGQGSGFKFSEYSGEALLGALRRAMATFARKTEWEKLMQNGMKKDFSWNRSVHEYCTLYGELTNARRTPVLHRISGSGIGSQRPPDRSGIANSGEPNRLLGNFSHGE